MSSMETSVTVVANVRGKARKVVENGREYLVAPVSLIVPGILSGSQGRIFYPADELAKDTSSWAGMPLTLDHPPALGDTDYVSNHGLGEFRNPRFDWSLRGEGWFDSVLTSERSPEVHEALKKGTPIEVSSGLSMECEVLNKDSFDHKGVPYRRVARNIKPDHVAVLSKDKGACSVADGCGVFNHKACQCGGTCPSCATPSSDQTKASFWNKLGEALGFRNAQPSHSDVRDQLCRQLEELYPAEENEWGYYSPTFYVVDVYDKYVIYEYDGGLYKLGYKTDLRGDGVTLSDEQAKSVKRVTTYKEVGNVRTEAVSYEESETLTETEPMAGLPQSVRDGMAARLVANRNAHPNTDWAKLTRDEINKLPDDVLTQYDYANNLLSRSREEGYPTADGGRFAFNQARQGWEYTAPTKAEDKPAPQPATAPQPVTNAIPVAQPVPIPKTDQELLATLPAHFRAKIEGYDQIMGQRKAELVGRLVANVSAEARPPVEAAYSRMTIEELTHLVSVMPQQPQVQNQQPVYDYSGAAVPAPVSAPSQEEPLPTPVYNWGGDRQPARTW